VSDTIGAHDAVLDDAPPQWGVESSINALPRTPAAPETADDYPYVVIQIDKTRVIAADIQWIIQRRVRAGRLAWQNQYFCRSKAGLLRFLPDVTELMALPDWFPDTRRTTQASDDEQ
jgi:hypothetical protein